MGVIYPERKERFKDVWLEKYRAEHLDELVLDANYRLKFQQFIEEKLAPSLLLVGPPGTGKTTFAYILIDALIEEDMDFLEINGSLFRGINVIRDILTPFMASQTFSANRKMVFIDEADKLTPDAQDSLRNIIEQNSDHTSFIFTANYQYKFSEALLSRLQTYTFKQLPKDYLTKHVYDILAKEAIQYKQEDVQYIIDATYPDMRKCLNEINKVTYLNKNVKTLSLAEADSDFLIEQKFIECLVKLNQCKGNQAEFVPCLRQAYDYVYRDTMDYLTAFSKMNLLFKNIKLKTLTAHYFNELAKVISPKFLMVEFIGEYLDVILRS